MPEGTGLAAAVLGSVISYEAPQTADDYRCWDDAGSWLLGYPFVPRALGLAGAPGAHVLDLGCGPGDVTRWVADRHQVRITAVDSSPAMIELARRHNAHEAVDYRLSVDELMPFLPDGSVDAAMASFLFTCVGDPSLVHRLIAEVARVLRPGGRFTLLVPNPDQVHDVSFEGFHRGEPGVRYTAGETMPIRVRRRDGSWTTITNTYWTRSSYRRGARPDQRAGPVARRRPRDRRSAADRLAPLDP
jgi:SAM-dependent methyltransferase